MTATMLGFTMDDRPHIFALTPDELADHLASHGMPRFRGKQVLEWVYQKGVANPQKMTNLSKADRDRLAGCVSFTQGAVLRHLLATDKTQKLLIDWSLDNDAQGRRPDTMSSLGREPQEDDGLPLSRGPEGRHTDSGDALNPLIVPPLRGSGIQSATDLGAHAPSYSLSRASGSTKTGSLPILQGSPNSQTECVMIPATSKTSGRQRRTACVSSQVGCPVGCKFCASGLGGLDGNLTAGQIVQQVWQLGQLLPKLPGAGAGVERITNVVFMGMGEPMSNFAEVTKAAKIMMADWALGISGRRITISTVGVPSGIRRLADLDLPVTLAISLHAPNDEVRRQIIPWAQFVTIDQLIEAGSYYFDKTGREVTLEYILLGGVNDQPAHARELAGVCKRLRANVNLIRYNEVKGMPFRRPGAQEVHDFQAILQRAGVNTHIRASRGRDIAAACGQLRHEHAQATP